MNNNCITTITCDANDIAHITLYNLSGQVIFSRKLTANTTSLNLDNYISASRGIYIFDIKIKNRYVKQNAFIAIR